MKNTYVKPEMQVEEFLANQYVAACGDTEYGKYLFTCDAPGGSLYYFSSKPASGAQPSVNSSGTYIGEYHPCGTTHEASTKADFYWGYVDKSHGSGWSYKAPNGKLDSDELVIVWRGERNNNGHATSNINQESWVIVKS
ncbi:MAG: hypothetical protein MJZ83_01610 [Bacteroidaceae bacterium]|nr:hypothetical protein [Bacteroidaceae bacterium]